MRRKRRSLTPRQRNVAALRVARLAAHISILRRHPRVAVYLSNDGEISPSTLVQRLWKAGRQVFLPVLHPLGHNSLWFIPYHRHTPLRRNRYGIPEPSRPGRRAPPWTMSLVFTPLVAFDPQGNRIGMGGGFYDRTFDRRRPRATDVRLTGLAHAFQEVGQLPFDPWDTPLHAVVTDCRRHFFRGSRHASVASASRCLTGLRAQDGHREQARAGSE